MKIHFHLILLGILASNTCGGTGFQKGIQFYAGLFNFDLQGTGNENHIGFAYINSVNNLFSLKASTTYIKSHQQFQQTIPLLIPEIGVDIGKQFGMARIFSGVGTQL